MLSYISKNIFKVILLLLLIFAIGLFYVSFSFNKVDKEKQIVKPKQTIISLEQSLKDSIYTEILNLRLDHPEIVYQQIIHETGNLSSSIFKSNHNLFGMRASGNRATTSNKVVNGYKWYSSWRESLLDYALFQMAYYKNLEKDEYYSKLSKSYAEDENYITLLKSKK